MKSLDISAAKNSAIVELKGIHKSFEGHIVLENLNLVIYSGEFITLLGPSGCGKTTTLRLLAGFETPDAGEVFLNGQNVTHLPPNKRTVNTVFQSYALFPHMTVYENVAFGLKMAKLEKREIDKRVKEVLGVVKLTGFEKRKPAQLSGGQQQRVAIARAVVNKPSVLLLDEPLSALDAKLRYDMCQELKRLQTTLGIAFVLVTHDQEEALSISDRVVVMNEGKIQQIGTPKGVYETPANLFTARFVGDINIFPACVLSLSEGFIHTEIEGVPCKIANKLNLAQGEKFLLLLRPEDMRLYTLDKVKSVAEEQTTGKLFGEVELKNYRGATLDTVIRIQNSERRIFASEFFDEDDPDFDYKEREVVSVGWVDGWEVILPYEVGNE